MAKYDPLAEHLRGLTVDRVILSFAEIEELVGTLPRSALDDRTWWGNTHHKSRVQAHAWLGAGWKVETPELESGQVSFVRA